MQPENHHTSLKVTDRVRFDYQNLREYGTIIDIIPDSNAIIITPDSQSLKDMYPNGIPLQIDEVRKQSSHKIAICDHHSSPISAAFVNALAFGQSEAPKAPKEKVCFVTAGTDIEEALITEAKRVLGDRVDITVFDIKDFKSLNAINKDEYKAILLAKGTSIIDAETTAELIYNVFNQLDEYKERSVS